jgi:hypothetical protein
VAPRLSPQPGRTVGDDLTGSMASLMFPGGSRRCRGRRGHNRDAKFTATFNTVFTCSGIQIIALVREGEGVGAKVLAERARRPADTMPPPGAVRDAQQR